MLYRFDGTADTAITVLEVDSPFDSAGKPRKFTHNDIADPTRTADPREVKQVQLVLQPGEEYELEPSLIVDGAGLALTRVS